MNESDKTIWKYELITIFGIQEIAMPSGSVILTLQLQNGIPCLWVLVEPDKPIEKVIIKVLATEGSDIISLRKYIGTYQIGGLVFHVFNMGVQK